MRFISNLLWRSSNDLMMGGDMREKLPADLCKEENEDDENDKVFRESF